MHMYTIFRNSRKLQLGIQQNSIYPIIQVIDKYSLVENLAFNWPFPKLGN